MVGSEEAFLEVEPRVVDVSTTEVRSQSCWAARLHVFVPLQGYLQLSVLEGPGPVTNERPALDTIRALCSCFPSSLVSMPCLVAPPFSIFKCIWGSDPDPTAPTSSDADQ
jgi:hypothetical protein